jgi:hypothetical protein
MTDQAAQILILTGPYVIIIAIGLLYKCLTSLVAVIPVPYMRKVKALFQTLSKPLTSWCVRPPSRSKRAGEQKRWDTVIYHTANTNLVRVVRCPKYGTNETLTLRKMLYTSVDQRSGGILT